MVMTLSQTDVAFVPRAWPRKNSHLPYQMAEHVIWKQRLPCSTAGQNDGKPRANPMTPPGLPRDFLACEHLLVCTYHLLLFSGVHSSYLGQVQPTEPTLKQILCLWKSST